MKTAFVTGYTGQDGTFLTKLLLEKGYKVVALVRRISTEPPRRVRGSFDFREYIDSGMLKLEEGDLLSRSSLDSIITSYDPDEIYNLAAQSHVGISFKQPEFSIEADFIGVVNLIESLIHCSPSGEWKMYQASTSEMFGDKHTEPMNEQTIFSPNSPYAIAKAAAHYYCRMKRAEGYFISNGILFNHESEIRGGDFVTQKIVREVVHRELHDNVILKLGNIDSVRDWGYAGDYVKAMWQMLQHDKPDDFVVGTGETHTVREFVEAALKAMDHTIEWRGEGLDEKGYVDDKLFVEISEEFYRPVDVNFLKADITKVQHDLNWYPVYDFELLVTTMVKGMIEQTRAGLRAVNE
jgi:GDPmannose 4,6-dehydratase